MKVLKSKRFWLDLGSVLVAVLVLVGFVLAFVSIFVPIVFIFVIGMVSLFFWEEWKDGL